MMELNSLSRRGIPDQLFLIMGHNIYQSSFINFVENVASYIQQVAQDIQDQID